MGSQSFAYTGAAVSWVVPANVTYLTVDAYGGKGGDGNSPGANGGRVQTGFAVTPGETLTLEIAGAGSGAAAGWPNGGAAGAGGGCGGGGGATSIKRGATILMVAGGGGGGGGYGVGTQRIGGQGTNGGAGGAAGYPNGSDGGGTGTWYTSSSGSWSGQSPGRGATQSAAGVAQANTSGFQSGSWSPGVEYAGGTGAAGSGQQGGAGGDTGSSGWAGGGGGGGGYFGGGGAPGSKVVFDNSYGSAGGSGTGGGGGGSSYSVGTATFTGGASGGNGSLALSWNPAPNPPTGLTPASGALTLNAGYTFSWTHNDTEGEAQGGFIFRRKLGAGGTYEYYNVNTGLWQASEVVNSSTTQAYTFPAGKWPGGTYLWSVRTTDAVGQGSSYSTEQTVTSNSAPNAPTLGAPADGVGLDTRVSNTFSWTHSDPQGDVQSAYALRVRVAGGTTYWWNGSAFVTTETFITGAAASVAIPANFFGKGETHYWSVATKDATLQGPYATERVYYTTPPTPTALTPATGATINTDTPTLGATVGVGPGTGQSTQRVEFQLARDAAFTTNVRTILEAAGDARVSGATTEAVAGVNELFQGTWYLRARSLNVTGGQYSDWTATNTITVSHPPTAASLTPTAGEIRAFGLTGNITLDWTFSDTSPTDVQTAFQTVVERNSDGVVFYDSGKVVSSATERVQAINSNQKGVLLRWRVRLYDSDDVLGPYSAYQTFVVDDTPVTAITAPVEASTIQSGQPTITWTYSGSRAQATYRVIIKQGNTTIHDTGAVAGAATSWTPAGTILVNNTIYTVQVISTDTGGLTGTDTHTFTTSFAIPTAGAFTVNAVDFNTTGRVRITWTNATKEADWTGWLVYRRRIGGVWNLVHENRLNLTTFTFDDYYPASGIEYEYAVVQEVVRFGATLEGGKQPVSTGVLYTEYYWLIHPEDTSRIYRLEHVTSDSFTDEYEEETFTIIGRGRKKDLGTHLGISGSISASIHQDLNGRTAREQREGLEAVRADEDAYYLRTPFRDYWLVMLGNVAVERVAGTGAREHMKVSFTYQEVV